MANKVKTGECYFRDESGALWRADSYQDQDTGEVTTENVSVFEAQAQEGA